LHGSTLHGQQFQRSDLRDVPVAYFHLTSPVGQLLRAANVDPHRRLGVIGLGTGTLACYALPGQQLTFYDIDPLIRAIAYEPDTALFTFVADARRHGARVDLVLGDARVRLTQQPMDEPDRYGILVVDAFSADSIPIHLITREAVQVYLSHLREDGIIAFHISNHHLDLEPVLANLADDLALAALCQYGGSDERLRTLRSKWMLLARKPEYLRCVRGSADWKPPRAAPRVGVWTDDYSNVLSVFRP
jgi:spermidine synthase